jgi:uncharacterized membrane protein YqiK
MIPISLPPLFAAQAPDSTQMLMILGTSTVMLFVMCAALAILFAKFYVKPPPDHAIVCTGKDGLRAATGSGMWVIPVVHMHAFLSLAPIRVDLAGTRLDSEEGRSRQLPTVFQVAIGNDREMILAAAQRLLSKHPDDIILLVKDVVLDEYERLLAQESDGPSQDSPANRFIEGVEQALTPIGLTILACHSG